MNLLGKLSWSAVPFDQPIVMGASGGMILAIGLILSWVTIKGYWPYLWREWITSVDHKRIGVMYMILGLLMLVRGFADALMMRTQLALAANGAMGYLPPEHYDQIFSAHGTIMIFFVAMPFVIGLMNFALPLQLGVRDVAFPVLNSVSFWLTAAGVLVWYLTQPWLGLPLFILAAFCLYFFRDPERQIPGGPVAVAPADGKIVAVRAVTNRLAGAWRAESELPVVCMAVGSRAAASREPLRLVGGSPSGEDP